AGHRTRVVTERMRTGKSCEDIDAERLGFARQPRCQESERDDEVAVIAHLGRRRKSRAAAAREHQELIATNRYADIEAALSPLWQQCIERSRFHDGARQGM